MKEILLFHQKKSVKIFNRFIYHSKICHISFFYSPYQFFVCHIDLIPVRYYLVPLINSSFASLDYDPFSPENLYPEIMVMRPKAFVSSLVKGIAVVRMGNGGEQFRSLLQ